jgi:hypothetical protein
MNFQTNKNLTACLIKRIRMKKADSAFVYAVLEASEGIASYSTVNYQTGALSRDIDLFFSKEFKDDVERVLNQLKEITHEVERTEA